MTAAPLRLRSINSPSMSESCTGIDAVGKRSERRLSRPDGMFVFCHGRRLQVQPLQLAKAQTRVSVPHRHSIKQHPRKYGRINVARTLLSVLVRLGRAEKIHLNLGAIASRKSCAIFAPANSAGPASSAITPKAIFGDSTGAKARINASRPLVRSPAVPVFLATDMPATGARRPVPFASAATASIACTIVSAAAGDAMRVVSCFGAV